MRVSAGNQSLVRLLACCLVYGCIEEGIPPPSVPFSPHCCHPRCFVGKEIVSYMMDEALVDNEEEAVAKGQELMEHGAMAV